jgi:hypothetical protein
MQLVASVFTLLPAAGSTLLLLASCAQMPLYPQATYRYEPQEPYWLFGREEPGFPLDWHPGQVLLHGYLGAKLLSDVRVEPGGAPPIDVGEDDYVALPVVGGGAQWKLAGDGFDFGLEGLLALSGRADLEGFSERSSCSMWTSCSSIPTEGFS